ncbi:MAG TPA: hypothetical protein VFA99_01345 [Acidobacteriaceae bacterium]|nr:hypothetical protein [Acidobacteriaceae bacterium]
MRWGLLAGALLLIAVLLVLLSYGRYRAVKAWKQIVARSGATITHETDGVTWSQAVRGKTIFVAHAKHAVPHGQGRYTLEDGTLVLYGRDGQPADRISGAQFEYDEKQGVARAVGPVDIEVEPPAGLIRQGTGIRDLGTGNREQETEHRDLGTGGQTAQAIHVRTSGLTYVKKLGVAATSEDVEIDYAGMHGHARGAEFDSGQDVVHLLADVRVDGMLRGAPATLTAAKADLDREASQIAMTAPVLRSGGRMGSAGSAVLRLRKDGSVEAMEAGGGVKLQQQTRTITAATLRAAMNERSQMKSAELAGGVALVDTSAERPMNGTAKTARVAFDEAGFATSAVLDGGVGMSMEDRRSGSGLQRQMGADRLTLTMERVARQGRRKGGTRVSAVHAQGGAWARGDAVVKGASTKATGVKTTSVAADDLRLSLAQDVAGKDQPQSLSGTGHTRIEQRTPDGTVQTGVGDSLMARFAEEAGRGIEIASAEQVGNVRIKSVPGKAGELPSEGVAERAWLDGATNVLTLMGKPRLTRGDTSVTADTIRMMQQTGDAVAEGDVAGTFVSANAKPGELTPANKFAGGPEAAVTHAMAAEAVLHKAAQTMELKGTDAVPARLWQGASQVEAANILLDRGKDYMLALPGGSNGVVRAVFAEQGSGNRGQGTGKKREEAGERVVRVTSARLHYSGVTHEAVFTGGVTAQVEDGVAKAAMGVAFLTPKPPTGAKTPSTTDSLGSVESSLDRVVMDHGVKIEQPGRVGTGDELLYTASTSQFILIGTPGQPAHVSDDKQGSITGHALMFRSPDSTIVVEGVAPGLPGSQRVHTQTTVKK